jgi:hypothetical protein
MVIHRYFLGRAEEKKETHESDIETVVNSVHACHEDSITTPGAQILIWNAKLYTRWFKYDRDKL